MVDFCETYFDVKVGHFYYTNLLNDVPANSLKGIEGD